jgi:HAD superfamily hydrolase (TIGR01490 family)
MNLALFDFDGTITFKDSFEPFLYYAADPFRIAVGRFVLIPLVIGYKLRIISASKTRASVAMFGFRGRRLNEVKQAGARYARDVLPGIVRPKALERIEWHKAQGDVVVVVSAALDVYLVEWCRRMEVDLICTELEARDGILTGGYRDGDCVGEEKAKRILEKYNLQDYEVVYAYGDTNEDDEMLKMANRKFFRWQEITGRVRWGRETDRLDLDPHR